MPKGPRDEKRAADTIGRAVQIAKFVTGEIEEPRNDNGKSTDVSPLGKRGGEVRAKAL
jgi:hypothetical protein